MCKRFESETQMAPKEMGTFNGMWYARSAFMTGFRWDEPATKGAVPAQKLARGVAWKERLRQGLLIDRFFYCVP